MHCSMELLQLHISRVTLRPGLAWAVPDCVSWSQLVGQMSWAKVQREGEMAWYVRQADTTATVQKQGRQTSGRPKFPYWRSLHFFLTQPSRL